MTNWAVHLYRLQVGQAGQLCLQHICSALSLVPQHPRFPEQYQIEGNSSLTKHEDWIEPGHTRAVHIVQTILLALLLQHTPHVGSLYANNTKVFRNQQPSQKARIPRLDHTAPFL